MTSAMSSRRTARSYAIGYDRFEGIVPCRILAELYQSLRLYVNFFQPSLKLISKHHEGSKVIKKYDPAKTPYQRVLASETVSKAAKEALRQQYSSLDPVVLLQRIEQLQDQLWQYAHLERANTITLTSPATDATIVQTAAAKASSCVVAAQTMEEDAQAQAVISGDGASLSADEVQVDLPLPQRVRRYRRTKKPSKQVKRWWRTHKDAFEQVWPEAAQQLRLRPYREAKALFQALQRKYPGTFEDGQLRTFQRRVKVWRLQQVTQEHQAATEAAPPRPSTQGAIASRRHRLGAAQKQPVQRE